MLFVMLINHVAWSLSEAHGLNITDTFLHFTDEAITYYECLSYIAERLEALVVIATNSGTKDPRNWLQVLT